MSDGNVPQAYWKSLLELSTGATASGESLNVPSTSGEAPTTMTEDNKDWLEDVMADLVKKTDPSKQLSLALSTLNELMKIDNVTDEVNSRIEEVGNALCDLLLFADLTHKFASEGGFEAVTHFMAPKFPVGIQVLYGDIILTLADNNPPAQEAISKFGLLEQMVEVVQDVSREKAFRLKLLGAIGACVRSHEPSLEKFMSIEGNKKLASLFKDKEVDIAMKAARIICTIAFTYSDSKKNHDKLFVEVCDGYITALSRGKEGGGSEVEYIRDFIVTSMKSKSKIEVILRDLLHKNYHKEKAEKLSDIIKTLSQL